jgi:polysaccharide export outer membrane protein
MKKAIDSTGSLNLRALEHRLASRVLPPLALIAAGLLAGCQSDVEDRPIGVAAQPAVTQPAAMQSAVPPPAVAQPAGLAAKPEETITLRESDVVKVSFPSSPTLDTTQQIRRDGKITLPLVGEVDAAGLTPQALEKKLVELYAPQISSKQITVEVESSSYPVYVTGSVQRSGKVLADHPITALEAVMEAGGFDTAKANTKAVKVIRREKDGVKTFKLNLQDVLDGKSGAGDLFELKPDDIVFVPERFTWF